MQFAGLGVNEMHAQRGGEETGLIGFGPVAGNAQNLLQADDIGVDFLQHAGNALGPHAPVHALALMDVVGGDAYGPHT